MEIPRQMALVVAAGVVPCRHCLLPTGEVSRRVAFSVPETLPTGKYRMVNGRAVPVNCPVCAQGEIHRLGSHRWACYGCGWTGRVITATWERHSSTGYVGQYRIVRHRRAGERALRILEPVACPSCGGEVLTQERTESGRRSKMWVCATCAWMGGVDTRRWTLIAPPPRRTKKATDGHPKVMHSRKAQADRLG